jgi:hypothetical protein
MKPSSSSGPRSPPGRPGRRSARPPVPRRHRAGSPARRSLRRARPRSGRQPAHHMQGPPGTPTRTCPPIAGLFVTGGKLRSHNRINVFYGGFALAFAALTVVFYLHAPKHDAAVLSSGATTWNEESDPTTPTQDATTVAPAPDGSKRCPMRRSAAPRQCAAPRRTPRGGRPPRHAGGCGAHRPSSGRTGTRGAHVDDRNPVTLLGAASGPSATARGVAQTSLLDAGEGVWLR